MVAVTFCLSYCCSLFHSLFNRQGNYRQKDNLKFFLIIYTHTHTHTRTRTHIYIGCTGYPLLYTGTLYVQPAGATLVVVCRLLAVVSTLAGEQGSEAHVLQ